MLPSVGTFASGAFAARIADGGGRVVDRGGRGNHVNQFGFVGRGHDDEVGQAAQIGEIEGAGMRRAVGADEAGAIDGETDGQILDGDVVDDLIVAALQECRINRGERTVAFGG